MAFAALFATTIPAAAQRVPHREVARGHITAFNPTTPLATQEFAAQGLASTMGFYSIEGGHQLNLATGEVIGGTFTSTTRDGSTISGTYSGTFRQLQPDLFQFEVRVLWLHGTGRLAGITGEADVLAFTSGATPGSSVVYFTDGFWVRP